MKKILGVLVFGLVVSTSMNLWAEEGTAAVPVKSETAAEAAPEPAAEAAGEVTLKVEDIAIATSIENRAPIGAAETFPATTEKLSCYTKISGGREGDQIIHRWSKNGAVLSEVTLKVNGSPWRTYSNKTIVDGVGKWTVEVLQNNQLIKSANFEILAQADEAAPAQEAPQAQ